MLSAYLMPCNSSGVVMNQIKRFSFSKSKSMSKNNIETKDGERE